VQHVFRMYSYFLLHGNILKTIYILTYVYLFDIVFLSAFECALKVNLLKKNIKLMSFLIFSEDLS
jgi:hypothetical protein